MGGKDEKVESCKYLGVKLNGDGGTEREAKERPQEGGEM